MKTLSAGARTIGASATLSPHPYQINNKIVEKFCKDNEIDLICRAHQVTFNIRSSRMATNFLPTRNLLLYSQHRITAENSIIQVILKNLVMINSRSSVYQ